MNKFANFVRSIHEAEHRQLLAAASEFIGKLPRDVVPFKLTARVSPGYDGMFSGAGPLIQESDLLALATKRGRIMLCGKGGGSGKTHLLRRLARLALDQKYLPVLISLRDWSGDDSDAWSKWIAEPGGGGAFLLDRFTEKRFSPTELDLVPPSVRKILLIDGLNEISAPLANEILKAIDELVRDQMQTSAIISDRVSRRELPSPHRWAIAMVQPIDAAQIRSGLKAVRGADAADPLLSSPFFLDAAIKGTGTTSIPAYISSKSGLSDEQLLQIAAKAYSVYESGFGRTFPSRCLADVDDTIVGKMAEAELLRSSNGMMQFNHHLIHDYLAALYLARLPSECWTAVALEALSFGGSAFDAIAFVLIELNQERSDAFLTRLYDWNLYAAGYAINEADRYPGKLSDEILIVILAMLAEKRFDPVLATRERANDALLVSQLERAAQFAQANTLDDVIRIVSDSPHRREWFQSWRELFTIPHADLVSRSKVEYLFAVDSISGWTLANVLRRLPAADWQRERLIAEMNNATAPVRWRIAHVLGASPTVASIQILFGLLDRDLDSNVRYGAIRSLAESAWRSEREVRDQVNKELCARLPTLRENPKLLDELVRATLIDGAIAPEGWGAFVLDIAKALFVSEESVECRDRWRRMASEAEHRYGHII